MNVTPRPRGHHEAYEAVCGAIAGETNAQWAVIPGAAHLVPETGDPFKRDFRQVEKDAWAAREPIGDVPIRVITVRFSQAEIADSPFPEEQRLMPKNVERQKGWLVLSPSAEQVVVDTGHAVAEDDPELVIDTILEVVKAAR